MTKEKTQDSDSEWMHDRKSQGPLIHDGDHRMWSVVRHSISLSELDLLSYILASTQYWQ